MSNAWEDAEKLKKKKEKAQSKSHRSKVKLKSQNTMKEEFELNQIVTHAWEDVAKKKVKHPK